MLSLVLDFFEASCVLNNSKANLIAGAMVFSDGLINNLRIFKLLSAHAHKSEGANRSLHSNLANMSRTEVVLRLFKTAGYAYLYRSSAVRK